jgi:dolichol-phosphate mannosyltransferase
MASPPEGPPRILVSLATYNERENLPPLVKEILHALPQARILVVDDNSPDGTGRIADEMAAADPRVIARHRPGKLGLGTAILAAMRFAIDEGYDWLINMDVDFSHHPRYLPALVAGMDRHDVMIGSRYVPGGGTVDWPRSRQVMSWGVNLLVRFLLRLPARDCSGAYRCYRVSKLREARLDRMISRGYSFQQEVLYRCRKARCRLGETPIVFADRRAGSSKVNPREVARSLAVLFYLGLKAFFGFDRWEGRGPQTATRPEHTSATSARQP